LPHIAANKSGKSTMAPLDGELCHHGRLHNLYFETLLYVGEEEERSLRYVVLYKHTPDSVHIKLCIIYQIQVPVC